MLTEHGKKAVYFANLINGMDEVQKRRTAGFKALEIGWGGISKVSRLTGMSRITIAKGIKEIKAGEKGKPERLRRSGGGRKRLEQKNPKTLEMLNALLEESTAGDPMSLLKWTNKSTTRLAEELTKNGCEISYESVRRKLKEHGYSLQSNRKNKENVSHPERDSQFRYINKLANDFAKRSEPVISVDTKKKELIGNFKNQGKTWRKKGRPEDVNIHDFPQLGLGKVVPYGAYDIALNNGFVNVGVSSDTAEFAVESIRQWWKQLGEKRYPKASELLICADSGGSNGSRNRGWKYFLHKLATETGMEITVCHYPPGTSKWNKIEHKLFSFISMNWRGKPLISYEVIVSLIRNTKTQKGLEVFARLDKKKYAKGRKFSDDVMEKIPIARHRTNPLWNYSIAPIE